MDHFGKARFNTGVIALLVCLNLLVMGMFWWTLLRRPPLPVPPSPPPDANRIDAEPPDVLPFLTRELYLSREQMRRLRTLREEALPEIRAQWLEMQGLRRQIHAGLFREDVDPNQIRAWSQRLGELQADLEWTKYEHLLALNSICTPPQRARLQRLLDDALRWANPPGRPGPWPPGRRGPGRRGPGRAAPGPGRRPGFPPPAPNAIP